MTTCGCGKTGSCSCFIVSDPAGTMTVSGDASLESPLMFTTDSPGYIRPAAKSTRTTTQSINTGILTTVSFDTEVFDLDNMINIGGFPTRITIVTPGIYYVGGTVPWTSVGNQVYRVYIRRNGLVLEVYDDILIPDNISPISHALSDLYSCVAGDYFELVVLQNTGGPVTIDPTATLVGSGAPTPVALFALYMGKAA